MKSLWQKLNQWIIAAVTIIWPFIFLFPYVVPVDGKYLRIGSDFYYLYYKYKLYFLAFINSSHFPLWSPSEGGGYPFFSSPFGQAFYPLNIPLALFYRLTGGYTILDHQWFSVFGISIFSLGTYLWLRSLKLRSRPALFAALVMSVSFKMVNDIRFPNAVHSTCWYPWILYAITKIASSDSRKHAILYGFLLVFSSYSLITAGYPYYLYYSLFLVFPYGILILIPDLREKVFHIRGGNLHRTWITFALAGVLLILITSPYLIQLYQLLAQTYGRNGNNWQFSIFRLFGPVDSLGSLVYPPASYDEGWYHFGFIGFLLIMVFLFGKVKSGDQNSPRSIYNTVTKVVLVVWFLIVTYISWGSDSVLFAFLWRFLPGFSSLRQWGRLNIILVPLFAWLLALAYQYFETMLFHSEDLSISSSLSVQRGIGVLSGVYTVVLGIQGLFIYERWHNFYWTYYFLPNFQNLLSFPYQMFGRAVPSQQQIHHFQIYLFVFFGLLAFLTCLFLLLRVHHSKLFSVNAVFIVFLVLSGINEFTSAPWMWALEWDSVPQRSLLNVAKIDMDSFHTPGTNINDSLSLDAVFNRGTFHDWYFIRYITFLDLTNTDPGGTRYIFGSRNGQKIFFSTSIDPKTLGAFYNDSIRFKQVAQVDAYNGDYLNLTVHAPQDGFVSFIDNWDSNWKATVDGQPVDINLLFGTFKSVKVPAGLHKVVFAYCPAVFEILNQACASMR